jgi:hypothetical protein
MTVNLQVVNCTPYHKTLTLYFRCHGMMRVPYVDLRNFEEWIMQRTEEDLNVLEHFPTRKLHWSRSWGHMEQKLGTYAHSQQLSLVLVQAKTLSGQ